MKLATDFKSFEALRIRPQENLSTIAPRTYARLGFKQHSYVILHESDFQALNRASKFGHLQRAMQVLEAALNVLTDTPDTQLVRLTVGGVRRELNGLLFHASDAGQGDDE